ncbi:MAG TPA: hypothetical protein ENH12_04415 [Proteobacteria bacterium]|nr:hypothetical protein [Pseudomonadota bacterium]
MKRKRPCQQNLRIGSKSNFRTLGLLILGLTYLSACAPTPPLPPPQPIGCIDFEELQLGARFKFPDTLAVSGVTMVVRAFQWGNLTWTSTGFVKVESAGKAGGSGQELFINNVNLDFIFFERVNGLSLRFGEYGGNLNIDINGDFENFNNFDDINGQIIGGVTVSVVNGLGNDKGTITLTGRIYSFALGGQELWIDDVCP